MLYNVVDELVLGHSCPRLDPYPEKDEAQQLMLPSYVLIYTYLLGFSLVGQSGRITFPYID